MPTLSGSTFTGFTRPSDPINFTDLATQITTALGKTVTVVVTPTDIQVTGASLVTGDSTNIQTVITAYFYNYVQVGVPLSDNPNMSTQRHDYGVSEYALYQNIAAGVNTKTANRTYVNGVAQNGTAQTGDLVEWIETTTTASGTTTSYVTTEGATRTSGGTALCSTIFPDSIQTNFIDSTGVYAQGSPTVTSNKTVSIPFMKQGFSGVTVATINVLGSVAMNAIPNGVTVKLRLVGIAA